MKKELLVASALVTSLGMAGVAEAATATFSGKTRTGVVGTDKNDGSKESYSAHQQSSFSVSISETTDSGIKVSTGFDLTDENDGSTDPSGVTLTFTDGSKLDLIEAGNAYSTHLASVPGASGEQGLTGHSQNEAPTSLTYGNVSDKVGFEWHSAADAFGVDGLKVGLSASDNTDASGQTTTSTAESAWSIGVSYVTDAGDTTVTIGGGIVSADTTNTSSSKNSADSTAVALTAATGDLTVGVGYAGGDYIASNGSATGSTAADISATDVDDVSVMTAGAKYVSGDITFAIGVTAGEGTDSAVGTAASGSADAYDYVGASIDYVVAPGVTATFGYSDEDAENNGTANS